MDREAVDHPAKIINSILSILKHLKTLHTFY